MSIKPKFEVTTSDDNKTSIYTRNNFQIAFTEFTQGGENLCNICFNRQESDGSESFVELQTWADSMCSMTQRNLYLLFCIGHEMLDAKYQIKKKPYFHRRKDKKKNDK